MNEIARKKRELSRQAKILAVTGVLTAGLIAVLCSVTSYAASVTVDLGAGNAGAQFGVLEALLVVTLLALAPTLLIMMTSFTRIVIVLSFLRNALGTQQSAAQPGADRPFAVPDHVHYVAGVHPDQ